MTNSHLNVSAACALTYTDATRGLVPIPASERDLPSVTAEPYFKVSDDQVALEGPAFDRPGNLYFVDVHGSRILRLTPRLELTTINTTPGLRAAGLAIHQDGRIFAAGLGDLEAGSVVAMRPDGTGLQVIVPPQAGHVLDDLVFDSQGGFYMTDFRGSPTEAIGGVYYVAPGFERITPVLTRMCAPNGVALSPDGKVLWVTEFANSRLHRIDLLDAVTVARSGAVVPYHFVGRSPDSMRTDALGNVYVAMYQQGRILVFSPFGIPIGQILLPGRRVHRAPR